MRLVFQGILHGQDAAPGVTQQEEIVPVQPEGPPHLLHLFDETFHSPQVRVIRLIGISRPQLVIVEKLVALKWRSNAKLSGLSGDGVRAEEFISGEDKKLSG
jgi:hypothetical protein